MQIKIRYDDSFQTVEVTEAECESMIRNDYEERLAAAADPSTVQPRTMQEIMDEKFNRPEYNNYRQHRVHTASLDAFSLDTTAFVDDEVIGLDIERDDLLIALRESMELLLPQQIDLIQRIFVEGKTISQVAREEGVNRAAISIRLSKIYKKLRTNLRSTENF